MNTNGWLRVAASAVLTAATPPISGAQSTAPAPSSRAATIVAGPDYAASGFVARMLGEGWRDVWTTPIVAPVFDMSRFAGGVTPTERGGGNQTVSLRFKETGGWREYAFRSVNKDPVTLAMPAAVRGTPAGALIQDLTSSLYPAGGVMVPPLLDAIGVLHVSPSIYVMPDDPRLGEHRKTFAGMLGTVELVPQDGPEEQPGFAGAIEVQSGEDFLLTVDKARDHVLVERELFAARLVDFIINDNDRTADNIRFARFGEKGNYQWRPVPRDRDRAFTDARGWLFQFLVRPFYPKLIKFEPKFSLSGLTFESHNLDRRLLQRLSRTDIDTIARRVQRSLDDATIDKAIAQLPAPWRARSEGRLRSVLRSRRDNITSFAADFYQWLATEVDLHGTDEAERATITRHNDGRVTVAIAGRTEPASSRPFSIRTFLPSETNEVRVFLGGGDDSASVVGEGNDAITVRVIGEDGNDILIDSAGHARFYDAKGSNEFVTTETTRVSLEEWNVPAQGQGSRFDAAWRPDWGSSLGWGPTFDFGHGAGLIVGFGPRYSAAGFRRLPHKWKAAANVLLGTGNMKPGVSLSADYRAENSPLILTLAARATRFEEFRFHGYGNEVAEVADDLSKTSQDLVVIEPALVWQIGWRTRENFGGLGDRKPLPGLRPMVGRLEAGPVVYWTDPGAPGQSPLADPMVGGGSNYDAFGRAGLRFGLSLDRTSHGAPSDRGWTFDGELAGYPPLWDIDESFGTAAARIAGYLPLPGPGTHLALRAGGEVASGGFPVQHAPAVGGRSTVRGFGYRRYTGESSAFGSVELRVPVGMLPLLIKWNAGVFGLADAGRVWFQDESPGGWHSAIGAGVWLTSLGQTFSFAFAHGEDNRFYIQRGLSF